MKEIEPTMMNAIDVPRSRSQKCNIPVNRKLNPRANRNKATKVVLHGQTTRVRPSGER